MNTATAREPDCGSYREQVSRLAEALAAGRTDAISRLGVQDPSGTGVMQHLANAFGERHFILSKETQFVALAFENIEELIGTYMRQVPAAPYNPDMGETARFLRWLEQTRPTTEKQRDFITYQKAELAVAAQARRNRSAHLRFQRMWRRTRQTLDQSVNGRTIRVHLNPIREWARLRAFSRNPADGPADVLFFAAGTEVQAEGFSGWERTAIEAMDGDGAAAVAGRGEETRLWPSRWSALCRRLAERGIAALQEQAEPQPIQ